MTACPSDLSASIRRRLLNLSRATGEDHQLLLTRFALERLLARLSASEHRDRFVLKGALLFRLWSEHPHRATRDLDLLGKGDSSTPTLVTTFAEIVSTPVEPDGLSFESKKIAARPIREGARYSGVRLTIPARLGKTRFRLQVDVGFGDAVLPRPRLANYPTVLDHTPPRIKVYPPEAVVAEKLEALVSLGMVNSRMKDIYDLWTLAGERAFAGLPLCQSIEATFRRRGTAIPEAPPIALTHEFSTEPSRLTLWGAFLARTALDEPSELQDAIDKVAGFSWPVLKAIAAGKSEHWLQSWRPGGPWRANRR
mgnify:CR=1 FL=1